MQKLWLGLCRNMIKKETHKRRQVTEAAVNVAVLVSIHNYQPVLYPNPVFYFSKKKVYKVYKTCPIVQVEN